MKSMKYALYCLLLCGLLLNLQCTHKFIPNTLPVNQEKVLDFSGPGEVQLNNVQTSTEYIKVYRQGIHTYKADLNAWTDKAIGLVQEELEKREFSVTENGSKALDLAITLAQNRMGFMVFNFTMKLKVKTGDGYENEYEVKNTTPGSLKRAAGGAITLAVTEMLKDPKIIEYLEN